VHERCQQATDPAAKKHELVATKPNEMYSWDITKLLGRVNWTYYSVYGIRRRLGVVGLRSGGGGLTRN